MKQKKNAEHSKAVEQIKEYKRQANVILKALRLANHSVKVYKQAQADCSELYDTINMLRQELAINITAIKYLKHKIYQANSDYQYRHNNGRKEPGAFRG